MNPASRRFPWKSIVLLLAGYIAFGRFLAETGNPRLSLGIGIALALALAFAFLHPLTSFGRVIRDRFQSDAVAFWTLMVLAGFSSVFFTWFKVFLPILMILACEALTRIDFRNGRFGEKSTCFWMTLTSWIGLGIGWVSGMWELHGFAWMDSMFWF